MPPDDKEYQLRYSRHLALPDFGTAGQAKLSQARALVVGLGGLGSPAALYLAAAGIGGLMLNDFDRVDLSNLQRQILYGSAAVNRPKSAAAAATIAALNPYCQLELLEQRLSGDALEDAVRRADVVLDASDNFGTRFAVNSACMRAGRPLVSGAAIRYQGQLAVFDPRDPASPCYACLYEEGHEELEDCRSNGVLAPLTGVIGSLMAVEVVKLVSGVGEPLTGRLLRFDARTAQMHTAQVNRDGACPICSHR